MSINLNLAGKKEDSTRALSVESAQYIKKVDFVDASDLIYIGEAVPGTATSAGSWRISKINTSDGTDDDITIQFADGNANFDNIWDNHLNLSYS